MSAFRIFLIVLLLGAGSAHAQSPGEISFWESVRDSRNPDELRAYLQQYPNGAFKPLAESRLKALEKAPSPPPPVASAAPLKPGQRMPQTGDSWTYRLSYPRLRGQWGQAQKPPQNYVATISAASAGAITDQVSLDGGTPVAGTHTKGGVLIQQGAAVFSPYFAAFEDLPASGRVRVTIDDPGCSGMFRCEASGRVAGRESVSVPAGKFDALRVVITQEWSPAMMSTIAAAQYQGGRTLTVWYVPDLRRAVKFASRITVGTLPPMDANFDLELVSYQLK